MADDLEILRVKGSTSSVSLAATIAHGVYAGKKMTLRAIGAAAVNQAVKAIAIAQGYTAARGHDLWWKAGFDDVEMPDRTVTAIILKLRDD